MFLHAGISIGFLKGEYTFSEGGDTIHTVAVTKSRPTEQEFSISIIIQSLKFNGIEAATVGKDVSGHSRDHYFSPDEDSLTVIFEIFDDAIPEGTEGFQIISSASPHGNNPDFDCSIAEGCFTSTLIVINDNDGKWCMTTFFVYTSVTIKNFLFLCRIDCRF